MYVKGGGMGALNCPGDPGCPGYVEPGGQDWQNSMLEEILSNQLESTAVGGPVASTAPASSGLGISGKTLTIAGAALFGVVLIMKAGR